MDRITSVWYYTPSAPIAFSFPGSAPQPELTSTSAVVFFSSLRRGNPGEPDYCDAHVIGLDQEQARSHDDYTLYD
jgi:hypothetical protein